ncbi:hypothetical protein [Natrialba sp. INN-245]|uniref:hypothetical protein n=1 Tax=Natrialba sp. INN-245 TaxID=2690967 RepID=UPI0013101B2D|nr:hypothetical protein [Natrialba sp. INN-245]MWV41236.1 hypothetical protein [Natrialba sp. INN-245]
MTDSPIRDDRSTSEATPRRSTADRSSAETTSRRTALKAGIATVGALSLFGTGVSALETGSLEYNEDTELMDSAHSYQFSVTNTHDRTAIIQYLQLAELDYHTIALDNLDGDDTIEITPANGGHTSRVSDTFANGGYVMLVTKDSEASINPGETATVKIGPYYEADAHAAANTIIHTNHRKLDISGFSFRSDFRISYVLAQTEPGVRDNDEIQFSPDGPL